MDLDKYQDDFWRDALASDPKDAKGFQDKYASFLNGMQNQIAHLPQEEQDKLVNRAISRNTEYISIAKKDREALKIKLGMSVSPIPPNHLVQVAAETAVRATVWHSVSAFFRLFR